MLLEEEKKAIEFLQKYKSKIETVLNMLKEKDKYIKDANDITTEMSNDIKKLTSEIEKKDKIIDRMSITIIQKDIGKDYCEFNKSCEKCEDGSRDLKCKGCIKQYFKEIAEESSSIN